MTTDRIICSRDGAVGQIVFNNPDRHNAMSLDMWRDGEAAIRATLFQMVIAGLIKPSGVPVRVGRASAKKIAVSPVARADAVLKRPSTTNLLHESTPIHAVDRVLLPHLDGTTNRVKLRCPLMQAVQDGRIKITDNKTGIPLGGDALEAAVTEHVDLAITRLADAALLEPEAG